MMYILFPKGELNIVYQNIVQVIGSYEFVMLDIPSTSLRHEI